MGDEIRLVGAITVTAAQEMAAAAERHGWTSVRVKGSRAFRDATTLACELQGIPVVNHKLSPKSRERLEFLWAEQEGNTAGDRSTDVGPSNNLDCRPSQNHPDSAELYKQLLKRRGREEQSDNDDPAPDADAPPVYAFRPPMTKRPDEREKAG